MNHVIFDLYSNIINGIRFSVFRKASLREFRVSSDQIALLVILNIFIDFGHDYLTSDLNPAFNANGIPAEALSIFMLMFACYIINRLFFNQEVTLSLFILFLSICPPLMVVWGLVYGLTKFLPEGLISGEGADEIYAVLVLAVFCWSLWTITGRDFKNVTIAFSVLVLTWLGPSTYFTTGHTFWAAIAEEEKIAGTNDPYEAYEDLDVEGMYYAQPQLLTQTLQSLHPGVKGKKDVFFIGVGAWALQDVFLKETMYAKGLFDHRFESQNRSVILINNLTTYETTPLATSHNLNRTLHYMGTIMNSDEDLLILYMTSHGSKDHKLSVNFWPLGLNDISPDMLRQYLDEAGIRWRVIMVSACYSGGFIEPLKTPYTAIASAAAPDRQSFGCGNKSEFTYFGEALLKDQLQERYSFPLAFSGAIKAIEERELHENLNPSFPQFFVGDDMKPYLKEFSDRLISKGQVAGTNILIENHPNE